MWQNELSVEAQAARNLGDEDWDDIDVSFNEGCHRTATQEVEHFHVEAEPNIDKFISDIVHQERQSFAH